MLPSFTQRVVDLAVGTELSTELMGPTLFVLGEISLVTESALARLQLLLKLAGTENMLILAVNVLVVNVSLAPPPQSVFRIHFI